MGFGAAGALSFGAPVIPTSMDWIRSYETLAFDTSDGDLGMNDYAIYGIKHNGNPIYLVRTHPKDDRQWEITSRDEDILGKTEVDIVCDACKHYSEFRGKRGEVIRVPMASSEYERIKLKDELPPQMSERLPIGSILVNEARAAIAFDATSNSGIVETATSASFSHTSTGSNLIMILGFGGTEPSGGCTSCDVTAATYNGDAITSIRRDEATAVGDTAAEIMYRLAPDTGGSYTVSVTLAGNVAEFEVGVITLTGANQVAPEANSASDGDGTAVNNSVTTITDNAWTISNAVHWDSTAMTTARDSRWSASIGFGSYSGSSHGPVSPAAATAMNWTASISEEWVNQALSIAPAAGAPSARRIFTTE